MTMTKKKWMFKYINFCWYHTFLVLFIGKLTFCTSFPHRWSLPHYLPTLDALPFARDGIPSPNSTSTIPNRGRSPHYARGPIPPSREYLPPHAVLKPLTIPSTPVHPRIFHSPRFWPIPTYETSPWQISSIGWEFNIRKEINHDRAFKATEVVDAKNVRQSIARTQQSKRWEHLSRLPHRNWPRRRPPRRFQIPESPPHLRWQTLPHLKFCTQLILRLCLRLHTPHFTIRRRVRGLPTHTRTPASEGGRLIYARTSSTPASLPGFSVTATIQHTFPAALPTTSGSPALWWAALTPAASVEAAYDRHFIIAQGLENDTRVFFLKTDHARYEYLLYALWADDFHEKRKPLDENNLDENFASTRHHFPDQHNCIISCTGTNRPTQLNPQQLPSP